MCYAAEQHRPTQQDLYHVRWSCWRYQAIGPHHHRIRGNDATQGRAFPLGGAPAGAGLLLRQPTMVHSSTHPPSKPGIHSLWLSDTHTNSFYKLEAHGNTRVIVVAHEIGMRADCQYGSDTAPPVGSRPARGRRRQTTCTTLGPLIIRTSCRSSP